MKKFKKLAASLLALVMALGMVAPAMAANTPTIDKVLLQNGNDGTHTFTVYPIFKGAPASETSLVENTIDWATGVKAEKLIKGLAALKDSNGNEVFNVAIAPNDYQKAETAQKIAKILADNFAGGTKKIVSSDGALLTLAEELGKNPEKYGLDTVVAVNGTQTVDTGYCVIWDKPTTGDSQYMLWLVTETSDDPDQTATLTITAKEEPSLLDKDVWNPELQYNPTGNGWVDAAIYAGGGDGEQGDNDQSIKFRITVELPTTFNHATPYKLVLHDRQDEGLDFDSVESIKIWRGTTLVKTYYENGNYTENNSADCTIAPSGTETSNPCDFEVTIDKLNQENTVQAKDLVEVIYTAKANDKVKFGATGNNNKVNLEVNGEDAGESNAKVYELELVVDKVGSDKKTALPGAGFTLYKTDANGNKIDDNGIPFKVGVHHYEDDQGNPWIPGANDKNPDGTVILPQGYTAVNDTHFTLSGLEAGTYILEETLTPKDYNTINPIKITITADTTKGATTADAGGLIVDVDGIDTKNNQKVTFDLDENGHASLGIVSTKIVNNQGTLLPETGGMGTTIFYIGGAALVIGAVVLLITKRRMGSVDDE